MYDIIIIGGGAAGLSAAIYAMRGGMKTLVLEKVATGGQATKTYEIDNYPGFANAPSGPELMQEFLKHAQKYDVEIRTEAVREIENIDGDIKTVKTRKGTYETRTIILATGATPRKLGVPGEAELTGAGVSYCATCDGAFFKGLDTVVIGGGNTAMEDALYLARFCEHVFIMNRSKNFKASKTLFDKVKAEPRITVYTDMISEGFIGNGRLEKVLAKNTETGEQGFINASGVIIAIGITPENTIAKKYGVELCERGFVKTDMYLATNIPGVYAAGDCRVSPLRQVVTAAADGAIAATSAINYILAR
ncbi:MAG: FAD-dependent oxidoreductase [Clostridia bacterium]|nr:FAD-dependent oxidoreductase [Clostridia bacterium]